jgi:NAD dependent epimerase/dehydratase family enzyme
MARETVLISQRVRPARLEATGYEFHHPDLAGALDAALGR